MRIFISYRRADSETTAGRMAQFLDAIPVVQEVFLDVDEIAVGEDFEQRIQSTLGKATHVFTLIGPQWKGPAEMPGRPRIFESDDVVRHETGMALRSDVRVVPILLDDTKMPRSSELPNDLKRLPKINAFSLRTSQFDEDMDDLLDALIGGKKGRSSRWRQAPLTPVSVALRVLGGIPLGGLTLIGLGLANRYVDNGCYDLACTLKKMLSIANDSDALGIMWVIIIVVLGLGVLVPFAPRLLNRRR